MPSRFVDGSSTVLRLANGDTITIRRRLNSGEQREAYGRMYRAGLDGVTVNPFQTGLAMITAYLLDWNFTDDEGALVPIRGLPIEQLESVVNGLDPESFGEIKAAIEKHEAAMFLAREQEKKLRAGSTDDAPTSPSLSAADGASSGSVN